ncbi:MULTISPECIES: hypothetical protein [unclassified Streptomyces]|uniref:hypothetical protein n=1 Tax=unclassified Streptomyces TaxID=2593676 RepID=UPI002E28F4A0|nr:hypothetical protein [Streptomyces sp. NBC_01429]
MRLSADILDRIDEIVPPGNVFHLRNTGAVPPAFADPALRRRSPLAPAGGGAPGSEPEADPEDPSRPRTGRQRPQEPRRSAIHCPSTICAGEWTEVPK